MRDAYVPREAVQVEDLTFFADFENASADFSVTFEDGTYTVSPYSWMHFGIADAAGTRPRFRTPRPDHVDERRRLVWSADGDTWSYFDRGEPDGEWYYFGNDEPFDEDRVYVAGLFPYRTRDLERLRCSVRNCPYVRDWSPRGYSPERRPIYGLEIGSPERSPADTEQVVVIGGQHAWEAWGRQVVHGLVEAAVADDPVGASLREHATLYVYPMANPDGIARGQMRDGTADHNPNRAWFDGAPPDGDASPVPEIDILRRAIVEDTGGTATYLLDFHSHAGWYDRFMYYADGTDPAVDRLVDAVHRRDAEAHGDAIVGTHTEGGSGDGGPPTASRWASTLGATGLTVEATPYERSSRRRYREAGRSFAAGLADVLAST